VGALAAQGVSAHPVVKDTAAATPEAAMKRSAIRRAGWAW
jgi:hypothetical protein